MRAGTGIASFGPPTHTRRPMADTLFTRIIRGEIPCHKVYEDERVFAFLDIAPLSEGHTLVIPKEPAATLDELSEESAAALGRVMPRICRAVQTVTGVPDYNVLQNNGGRAHQAVPHVHFHIIPKPAVESSSSGPDAAGAGLGIEWPATRLDAARGAALAEQLAAVLVR